MKRLNSRADIISITGSVAIPYMETEQQCRDFLNDIPVPQNAQDLDQGLYLTVNGYCNYVETGGETGMAIVTGEAMAKGKTDDGRPYVALRSTKGLRFTDTVWVEMDSDTGWIYLTTDGNGALRLTSAI